MPMPALAQNDDTGHTVASVLAAGQYVVEWQRNCVDEFEPVWQKYPALQAPVGALSPDMAQYDPAVQGENVVKPVELQKVPIGLES